MYEEMGAAIPSDDIPDRERTIALIHETLDDAEFEEAWEHGRSLTDDEVDAIVHELPGAQGF